MTNCKGNIKIITVFRTEVMLTHFLKRTVKSVVRSVQFDKLYRIQRQEAQSKRREMFKLFGIFMGKNCYVETILSI